MIALVLAGLLAVDGGTFTQAPYDACPVTTEQARQVDAGWLLPPARAARTACLLATCETMGEPPPTAPVGYLLAAGAGIALGFIAGAVVVVALHH